MHMDKLIFRLICGAVLLPLLLVACAAPGPFVTATLTDATCRAGPQTTFSAIGTLPKGQAARILGTVGDLGWWEIKAPLASGTQCWVSAAEVTTSGDVSQVQVVSVPSGQVTALTISGPSIIHSECDSDTTNTNAFTVSMATNGPATVNYYLEVYVSGTNLLVTHSESATLTFASASNQDFNTGPVFRTDCGDFDIKVIVDSPNAISAQTKWSVVTP
jgi:uncharacterized protein YraI